MPRALRRQPSRYGRRAWCPLQTGLPDDALPAAAQVSPAMPLPIIAMFMSAPSCAAACAAKRGQPGEQPQNKAKPGRKRDMHFALCQPGTDRFDRFVNAHPTRHGKIVLRVSGYRQIPERRPSRQSPLAPSPDAGCRQTSSAPLWTRRRPLPAGREASGPSSSPAPRGYRQPAAAAARPAVHWPEKIGGHDPLHQRRIHHAAVEIFTGTGAENNQIGVNAAQRRRQASLSVISNG